ncbi:NUDIX domain-containing protein [Candidatus Saccharibacteria bacterium]|nr:NUDIX domain-containing protein [Candidatus Saccharibacteria bacterium]
MHYIQKYILDKLISSAYLRNRDMRPPHTESNLYQYHLKRLIDSGFIQKQGSEYTLSTKGLQYADRHSSELKDERSQPKLVTILLLENEAGEVLLIPRKKQPFIGMYNLPSGKIHEGESLLEAGHRELAEKVGIEGGIELRPAGTVHLAISDGSETISEFYGFVLTGVFGQHHNAIGRFFSRDGSIDEQLMPGVKQILQTTDDILEIRVDDTKKN